MINFQKLDSDEEHQWFSQLFDFALKESFILSRASQCFDPPPPQLFASKEAEDRINKKLNSLYEKLGGEPEKVLIREGALRTDRYDEFTWHAVKEIISLFDRARTGVLKTHAMFVAYWIIANARGTVTSPALPQEKLAAFEPVLQEDFWNCAETSYIRLASLWDRAGQLLDYVFFNIRQFEHDGFPSVLDRIKANFAALDPKMENTDFWKDTKGYAYSEKTDGLKWLLRRRNLLVHSLHLGDPQAKTEELEIRYYYNHLEQATRKKLGTQEPKEELVCLHSHLSAFIRLLEPLCDLCHWGVDLISDMRKKKEIIID